MKNTETVITMGTFDGVHRGHRTIVSRAVALARKAGLRSVAVTFAKPPRLYFAPQPEPTLLTTLPEKIGLLKSLGIDRVAALTFGRRLSRLSPEAFFDRYFVRRFRARAIVVGYNFRFGKGRSGDAAFLKRRGEAAGVQVRVVAPVKFGGVVVSSGRVREDLRAGELARANARLGYPYAVAGPVVRGRGLGKGLGFPTANIRYPRSKFVPPGVYAVRVTLPGGHVRKGMCNVGTRPTLGGGAVSMEAHIFGQRGDLVGRTLKVEFVKKLRAEKKFPSVDALKGQLARDARRALAAVQVRRTGRAAKRALGGAR